MNLGAFMDPEFPIFSTTLCYLEREDAYLMLHRIKKQDDYNHDKWVGVGGKFERFESPEDCLVREVREETGLTLTRYRARGLLTFVWGNMTEFIHLYTADRWEGEMIRGDACAEPCGHVIGHRLAHGLAAHAVEVIKDVEDDGQTALAAFLPEGLELVHGGEVHGLVNRAAAEGRIADVADDNPLLFPQAGV